MQLDFMDEEGMNNFMDSLKQFEVVFNDRVRVYSSIEINKAHKKTSM